MTEHIRLYIYRLISYFGLVDDIIISILLYYVITDPNRKDEAVSTNLDNIGILSRHRVDDCVIFPKLMTQISHNNKKRYIYDYIFIYLGTKSSSIGNM